MCAAAEFLGIARDGNDAHSLTIFFGKKSQSPFLSRLLQRQILFGDRPTVQDGLINIIFEGEDLFALDQKSLAEFRNMKLGFVFQFHYLLADFTALENVMMPALIGRIDDAEASRRATEMLEIVGLGDKLKRRPAELSGGEQQRVAVARAVVLRPKLLLADEPTGNLDPHTAAEVHDLFHKLNRELGVTLVIATHNEQLTRSVGRALRLHEGKLMDERR